MGNFNNNLLSGNIMLLDKQYYDCYSQASLLLKKYMDLCFCHSFYQLIAEPTKTTELPQTIIYLILRNSNR